MKRKLALSNEILHTQQNTKRLSVANCTSVSGKNLHISLFLVGKALLLNHYIVGICEA